MNVQELMTSDVKACNRGTNLAEAASMLWQNDCGILPVVDDANKVVGVISDRDICFAVATKGRLASDISVGELAGNRPLYTCSPEDSVIDALRTMQQQQVRRVPVVDSDGRIAGILSISDVVLAAQTESRGNNQNVTHNDAIATLKAICQRRPAQNAAAASWSAGQS